MSAPADGGRTEFHPARAAPVLYIAGLSVAIVYMAPLIRAPEDIAGLMLVAANCAILAVLALGIVWHALALTQTGPSLVADGDGFLYRHGLEVTGPVPWSSVVEIGWLGRRASGTVTVVIDPPARQRWVLFGRVLRDRPGSVALLRILPGSVGWKSGAVHGHLTDRMGQRSEKKA